MSADRRRKAAAIRDLLATEGDAVYDTTTLFNARRYEAIAAFDRFEGLRDEARAIKEEAIEQLPALIETVEAAVESNGGHVHVATDAADANRYIEDVVRDADAETVVKSKSMTTEEIEVNEHLEALGVEVFETDLGEFVIQVADEAPSHLIGPAIHKSRESIAELFNETFELEEPLETSEELTRFARDYLGDRIEEAEVGMTGANFVLADSGTVVIVTNEGNARKSAVTPDVYVAVTGVEKLLPSMDELGPFIELIARTGTGQEIANYVSLFSPPTDSPSLVDPDAPMEGPGDREFHLVLIDNGRLAMRDDDQLRETLYCIRCGACANSCANFQHVGGHAFGGETYTGGIGTGWEAGVEGLESAAEFNDLCTGCTRCVNACPVKIDIPWINTVVRDRIAQEGGSFEFLVEGLSPDANSMGMAPSKHVFGRFELLAAMGSLTAPVSNWIADSRPMRAVMDRWLGIDPRRALPTFQRETLRKWFERRDSDIGDPIASVVLYPDVYTNHVNVDRGKAAVRVLEALGVEVAIPAVPESGRAPLSQGMIGKADAQASEVYAALIEHIDDDKAVVVVEPSDLAMFRRDYERFLPAASFERLSSNTYEIMEYIYGLLENGTSLDGLVSGNGVELAYHAHCQQRTLGLESYTVAVFDALGYDVHTSSVECCGMAGSFGYKSEYYELSMDIGEDLAAEFADARRVVTSGTSCGDQLDDVLDTRPVHPVEVLDPWSR